MQNAAGFLARAALDVMGSNKTAVVFCGPGNNGGDGAAAAAILLRHGAEVRALLVGDRGRMTPDCREMERRLLRSCGELEDFDALDPLLPEQLRQAGVVIDAIFGIGLRRPLEGPALDAVRMINASGAPVVAADIPSGVEADTGRVLGEAVRCCRTVTFSMAKPGHFSEPGCLYCGKVVVADIGIPVELLQSAGCGVHAIMEADARLPARQPLSHKGDYGRLLIVGGSVGYTGAPSLCARAAVRSGAGLVFLGVPRSIYDITAVKNDEAMPFPLAEDANGRLSADALPVLLERLKTCDNCVIGPGLGRSEDIRTLILDLAEQTPTPLLVDADGLWALEGSLEVLKNAGRPVVLTPHEGEFVRMGGTLTGDRISDARRFAEQYGCVVVLKGHRSVCAFPGGEVYIATTGNAGMAKGGSGDVLAGVIGALMGQLPLRQAVTAGVHLHGAAGDLCAAEKGEYGMTPSDIVEALPSAAKKMTEM
jgi:NAD(P)H-hydrate epimerase